MTPQRYIVIQDWMLELGLSASELAAFALIYGFSQDGESDYHGSVAYVAKWCSVKERQARAILRRLVDLGIVNMVEYPGKESHYSVTPAIIAGGQLLPPTPANIAALPRQILPPNILKSDNKEIKKDSVCPSARARDDNKIAYGEYVRMTAAEHDKLVQRYGAERTARMCEILDGYLDNPKKRNRYSSHYRAILGWVVARLQDEELTAQRMKNAQAAGQRAQGVQQAPEGFGRAAADAKRRLEEIFKKYE